MKVLFLSKAAGPDYLCDLAFHGLRSLLGTDVVDVHRLAYMYRGFETSGLYGKGFSLYGLIDEGQVDRDDVLAKIQAKYFDLIVFGSIAREYNLLAIVSEHYPANKIVLLDGEDDPLVRTFFLGKGLYFKRELYTPHPQVLPIGFAIPEEKIQPLQTKTKLMAYIDPADTRTYIYNDEASYYADYGQSLFGKTMKKAGWDCLRHYEIMACNCIPYFMNIEGSPATLMTALPKHDLMLAARLLEYRGFPLFEKPAGQQLWLDLNERIQTNLRDRLTTKALARYILDEVQHHA